MTRPRMVLLAATALALAVAPDASPQDGPPAPQPKMTPAIAKAILELDVEILKISEILEYHTAVLRRTRDDCDRIEAELAAVTTRCRAGQATDADLERARRQVAFAQRRVVVAQTVYREAESQLGVTQLPCPEAGRSGP
ncbi:hypothetical protein J0H58_26365 [bacterium]|nr:hypothetical protein [bacterium]